MLPSNTIKPKRVEVYYSHVGWFHEYYKTIPNGQVICQVDGAWFTTSSDYEEPVSPVDENKYDIVIVEKPAEDGDGTPQRANT